MATSSCPQLSEFTGMLIRPDGYVAWASEDGGLDGLVEAIARWFRPLAA